MKEYKKSLDIFYLVSQLLESNLISHTRHGYQIIGTEIYLSAQNAMIFRKRSLSKDGHHMVMYFDRKKYTLQEIFDELPQEFKTKIIFHLDLAGE